MAIQRKGAEEKRIWGASCQRLLNDEALNEILDEVRARQIRVFEDREATAEQLAAAHAVACGIKEILAEMQRGVRNATHSQGD